MRDCKIGVQINWDSRLAGGRRNFEDDQASVLLQGILSGILGTREYCKGAGNLAAVCPLKTSLRTTDQGRQDLRAAWVEDQF